MSDASIYALVTRAVGNASLLEQGVLLVLAISSVLSWTIIIKKGRELARSVRLDKAFRDRFGRSADFQTLLVQIHGQPASPCERVFVAGIGNCNGDTGTLSTSGSPGKRMHLAVAHAAQSECAETERHLGILATIGSAAPFVGLLGTVWGILMTFQALGTAKSATIQVLGPPIAGALVATAAGLAVAIPAVVSYNWLSQRADTVNRGVRTFAEELERVIDLAPASGGSGQA